MIDSTNIITLFFYIQDQNALLKKNRVLCIMNLTRNANYAIAIAIAIAIACQQSFQEYLCKR
jgi:hypothetical protein